MTACRLSPGARFGKSRYLSHFHTAIRGQLVADDDVRWRYVIADNAGGGTPGASSRTSVTMGVDAGARNPRG